MTPRHNAPSTVTAEPAKPYRTLRIISTVLRWLAWASLVLPPLAALLVWLHQVFLWWSARVDKNYSLAFADTFKPLLLFGIPIVSGLVSAVLLLALSEMLRLAVDVARDVKRSADAAELQPLPQLEVIGAEASMDTEP